MSSIRTLDELIAALDNDLVWRKKELSILYDFITKNKSNSEILDVALRSGIALLYAHWEGFVKCAGTSYLEYVARMHRPLSELSSNFVALGMREHLQGAATSSQLFKMLEVTDILINKLEEKSSFAWQQAIQTKSNLSPQRFKEIVFSLGLDYKHYETKEKLLEKKLVEARHKIAHGKYLPYDEADFRLIYKEILDLMESFRTQLQNAAATKRFLSNPNLVPVA